MELYTTKIQIFAYKNDIVLVGRTAGVLKGAIINLSKIASQMRLIINLQKKKLMCGITNRPTNSIMLEVNDQEFERVRG
jgi:hypothetical protein